MRLASFWHCITRNTRPQTNIKHANRLGQECTRHSKKLATGWEVRTLAVTECSKNRAKKSLLLESWQQQKNQFETQQDHCPLYHHQSFGDQGFASRSKSFDPRPTLRFYYSDCSRYSSNFNLHKMTYLQNKKPIIVNIHRNILIFRGCRASPQSYALNA
jgi:hypothetical protein